MVDTGQKKRIVMVISQFYPLLGGAEVQAQQLARELLRRNMNVFVVTRKLKGVPRYQSIDGIPVYREIRTIPLGILWGISYMMSVFLFLYRRRNEYDIIHCHIVQGLHTVIAVLFKYLFNKRVLVKMSSSGITSDLKLLREVKLGRFLLRWIRKVDVIVSVCRQSSREIAESGFPPDVLVEIPNGIDTKRFVPGKRDVRNDIRNITYIGRLDGFKGVEYLLAGFKDLLSRLDDVRLNIVGSGPEERRFRKLAEELEIQEKVYFKGRREDIVNELQMTDVLVFPSLSEGMSNVLLEAMSCALPIVATSVGGNADLIRDGENGILVPPANAKSLSDALFDLFTDSTKAQRLGVKARETVERYYSFERVVNDYLELYDRLVAENDSSPIRRRVFNETQ